MTCSEAAQQTIETPLKHTTTRSKSVIVNQFKDTWSWAEMSDSWPDEYESPVTVGWNYHLGFINSNVSSV